MSRQATVYFTCPRRKWKFGLRYVLVCQKNKDMFQHYTLKSLSEKLWASSSSLKSICPTLTVHFLDGCSPFFPNSWVNVGNNKYYVFCNCFAGSPMWFPPSNWEIWNSLEPVGLFSPSHMSIPSQSALPHHLAHWLVGQLDISIVTARRQNVL